MPATAPSTAPANPLQEGMARIMGQDPFSATTGTSDLINYEDLGNRGQTPGDVITIHGDPGTGATTAETWSHDIALENLRRQELEFEYQQEQEALSNALRQAESARAAQGLAIQQAGESRAAGMYGLQQQAAAQDIALKAAAEKRAQDEMYMKYGGFTPEVIRGVNQNQSAYNQYTGGTNQPVTRAGVNAWRAAGYPGSVSSAQYARPVSPGLGQYGTRTPGVRY